MNHRLLLCGAFLGLALLAGCVDPSVIQERAEKARVSEEGLRASVQDGQTTRQEVLLRFGTPTATFEGGRILTFDLVLDPSGEWQRMALGNTSQWLYLHGRAISLVLVFGPEDRLVRHSLVGGLSRPVPPVQDAAPRPQS